MPSTISMTVSVIICAYTEARWTHLRNCIESVRRQTLPAEEIILVIDHNDALLARARAAYPDVHVVPNEQQQGLSRARNTGIAIASGDVIAFVDDDGAIQPDWLEQLCDCLTDPTVLGAGGTIVPRWEGKTPRWFPPQFYWTVGCTYEGQPRTRQAVRNLWGCMCVRREVFEAVGGFHTSIGRIGAKPFGDEETELCIRATTYWPHTCWLYEPKAVMLHSIPEARARWAYFLSRCYHEGLSKAAISRLVGRDRGLAAERSYTLAVLPIAAVRDVFVLARGDLYGPLRAIAIALGLLWTVVGYVIGTFSPRVQHSSSPKRDRHSSAAIQAPEFARRETLE